MLQMDLFCPKIANELETISSLKVLLCEVKVNKQIRQPITTSIPSEQYAGKG
jgi:pyrimidine operon attenuation protein/uracil phosphoribosyltransferase